jgi:RNA polymerase sigma factor (sigma-70 family)
MNKESVARYLNLVERVAKVEYRRIPSHMVDYEELVSIGMIAIQTLVKSKTAEEVNNMNLSYLATATRWAIRNELRSRYKWYTLKHAQTTGDDDTPPADGDKPAEVGEDGETKTSPESVREAIYETILSIEGISEGQDGDSSYDFVRDTTATPDERLEIVELGRAIKKAIETLPEKERMILEYRFYKHMQVKDIAERVGLSSSRITRIIQSSLNTVRQYLLDQEHIDE